MKTILSVFLAVTMAVTPALAQTNTNSPPKSAGAVMLLLAAGGAFWFIFVKTQDCTVRYHTIVLRKTQDWVHWTDVATNRVKLVPSNWTGVFAVEMSRDTNSYYDAYEVFNKSLIVASSKTERCIIQ